jgi:uncharacterized protein (UPF0179 family)
VSESEMTFKILVNVKEGVIVGCDGNKKGNFDLCKDCKIQNTCYVRLNYTFNKEVEEDDN